MSDTDRPQMHCDGYIHNPSLPMCLRWFLFVNRLPALDKVLVNRMCVDPRLFADYKNERVRVVMASRLGDVGITYNLNAICGYDMRVEVKDLSNFSEDK